MIISKSNKIILILLLFAGFSLRAQTITLSGTVYGIDDNPLEFANIIAESEENVKIRFAITNEKGEYKLRLDKNKSYKITTSYLGYFPSSFNINVLEDNQIKNFNLEENNNELEEIVLNYESPITVKKDTTIYKVDKFIDGRERKLKDVLKKLPGIEVDKYGNVTSKGKKVNKVMVEGKTFFTGNSKLAVDNIPADVLDEIEILENYNEISLLKGLEDSDDIAMNIKLKEEKKKFAFGDIEIGGGVKNRYSIHSNLFYYSPKTNINLISDFNNIGIKSFTIKDYVEFEGGFNKLINKSSSYSNLFNGDVSQYLNDKDFNRNINQFGALNLRYTLNKNLDINSYIISSKSKTGIKNEIINSYNLDIPFIEDRIETYSRDAFFSIGKIDLDYNPGYKESFSYKSTFKINNSVNEGLTRTTSLNQSNSIQSITDNKSFNLAQNINYSKKISSKHTGTIEANYNYRNNQPINNWLTNQEILFDFIPLQDDFIYNILQNKTNTDISVDAIIKDYWSINSANHIYSTLGINFSFNDYHNKSSQILSNGNINDFANFQNDVEYDFADLFISLEYKFQIGNIIFKPSVYNHFYKWRINQNNKIINKTKSLLLPQFKTVFEFNNSEKINLKYSLNAQFPNISILAENSVLSNFNSIFKGDSELENALYHSLNINYYKFNLYRNLNLNLGVILNKKIKNFKNVTLIDGIEQFNTQILLQQPEHTWSINGNVSKKINSIKYKLKTRFRYQDYFQIVNDRINKNISKIFSNKLSLETFFENYPNFELGYSKNFNNYRSVGNNSKFVNDAIFINLECDFLDNFIFKSNYSSDFYKNKNLEIKNRFDMADISLFYQKEESPFGFEININNLFDVKFRRDNVFSEFIIIDNSSFILPRVTTFKIVYKV